MNDWASENPNWKEVDLLMLEDEPADADLCLNELRSAGFTPHADLVQTAHEFCARISSKSYHVILADLSLPGWDGLAALDILHQMDKEIPFIVISGVTRPESAIECIRRGAADYVEKDRLGRLGIAVRNALEQTRPRQNRRQAEESLREEQRRYVRLAELSPDALLLFVDEKLVFLN